MERSRDRPSLDGRGFTTVFQPFVPSRRPNHRIEGGPAGFRPKRKSAVVRSLDSRDAADGPTTPDRRRCHRGRGRQGPIFDGYRGRHLVRRDQSRWCARRPRHRPRSSSSADRVTPGESATARAWVIAAYVSARTHRSRQDLHIRRGPPDSSARARVLEVRTDATPFPIQDVQDAKRPSSIPL